MSSHSRYDDRRHSSSSRRDNSQSSRRDRDSSRRSSPGSSRGRSPPPSPREREDHELPLEFGRPVEPTTKEDENTVIKRMKTAFVHSPLFVINRCVEKRLKIKIWTRNFKEVRGICTGYVLAFDKHWNLILTDVEEVYLKPKKAKTPFLLDTESAEDLAELPPRVPRVKKPPKTPEEEEEERKKRAEAAERKKERDEIRRKKRQEVLRRKREEAARKRKEEGKEEEEEEKKEKPEMPRKKKKGRKINKRCMQQLFVRGDNIVMLCVVGAGDEEDSDERTQN